MIDHPDDRRPAVATQRARHRTVSVSAGRKAWGLKRRKALGLKRLPDGLWEIIEPVFPPQRERPQGGDTPQAEDRAVFTAIVYVLTTGCAWQHLPAEFGVSTVLAYRRFLAWTEAGLWPLLHRAVLDRLGEQAAIDWSRAVADTASVRATRGVGWIDNVAAQRTPRLNPWPSIRAEQG